MITAVTDRAGKITGAHRTWLDPSGKDKAPIDTPRRAMGRLLGNAVRFDVAQDVLAAGEGIEIKGKKRHIAVDTLGLNLGAVVHPADIQDRDGGHWC